MKEKIQLYEENIEEYGYGIGRKCFLVLGTKIIKHKMKD